MFVERVSVSSIPVPIAGRSLVDYIAEDPPPPNVRPDLSGVSLQWLTEVAIMDREPKYGPPHVYHFNNFMALGPLSEDGADRVRERSSIIEEIVGYEYSYCYVDILAVVTDSEENNFVIYKGIYAGDTISFRSTGKSRYINNREIVLSLNTYLGNVKYRPTAETKRTYDTFNEKHSLWLLEQCCLWYILSIDNVNLHTILISTRRGSMSPVLLDISRVKLENPHETIEDSPKTFYFNVAPTQGIDSVWGESVVRYYSSVRDMIAEYRLESFPALARRRDVCVQYLSYHSRAPSKPRYLREGKDESLEEILSPSLISAELERRKAMKPIPITTVRVSTIEEIAQRLNATKSREYRVRQERTISGPPGGMLEGEKYTYSLGNKRVTSLTRNPYGVYEAGFMVGALHYFVYNGDRDRSLMVVTEIYRLNEVNSSNLKVSADRVCAALDAVAIYTLQGANNDLVYTVLSSTRLWRKNVGESGGRGFFTSMLPFEEILNLTSMCVSSSKSRDYMHVWIIYYTYYREISQYNIGDTLPTLDVDDIDIDDDLMREGEKYFESTDDPEYVRLGAVFYSLLQKVSLSCIQVLRMYKNYSDNTVEGKKVSIMERDGKDYDPVRVLLRMMIDTIGPKMVVVEKRYMKVKVSYTKLSMDLLSFPIISYVMGIDMGRDLSVAGDVTIDEERTLAGGDYDLFLEEEDITNVSNIRKHTPEEYERIYPGERSVAVLTEEPYKEVFLDIIGTRR